MACQPCEQRSRGLRLENPPRRYGSGHHRKHSEASQQPRMLGYVNWPKYLLAQSGPVLDQWSHEPAVTRAIFPQPLACRIQAAAEHRSRAIIERMGHGKGRLYPFQPVIIEWKLEKRR
jgi:hypothetical protein